MREICGKKKKNAKNNDKIAKNVKGKRKYNCPSEKEDDEACTLHDNYTLAA